MRTIEAKTILSTQNGLNIYRSRRRGLRAFDAKSGNAGQRKVPEEGEVKENAPELLETSLRRKRRKCMIMIGGMSEPYPKEEEHYGLMRSCLKLIDRYGFGATVQSNSALLLRDLDLLVSIHRKTRCTVEMSLCTPDEALGKKLEPDASRVSERLRVLHSLRDAGIPAAVCLTPFFPFVNDDWNQLRELLSVCVDAGLYGLYHCGFGVTLRASEQEPFYRELEECFPGFGERYRAHYGDRRELTVPNHEELEALCQTICRDYKIEHRPDRIFTYQHAFVDRSAGEQLSLFQLFPEATDGAG